MARAAALLLTASVSALAASSASSAASDSASTSVGSVSDSIQKSSDSSSKNEKVAEGNYKIIDVAAVAEKPGMVRLKLQAVADTTAANEFFLYVPQKAMDQARLQAGQVISAKDRPYGTEFAKVDTQQAFFLVMADDWFRELQSKPVAL